MGFELTAQQRAVVENRGGELLVSAAAGSGKTRVLVERLLGRVENEGENIDRFLVITYTKAAAGELRARIVEELSARLAERPGDRHLRRQTTRVYQAQISTIHSFCAQLLRENGHLLDIDPDFRLCDESEAAVLMAQTMDEVIEQRYENLCPEDDFAQLLDLIATGRDDSRLIQITLDIHSRVQSHPNPEAWLEHQLAAFSTGELRDAGETVWGAFLLENAGQQAQYWRGQMAKTLELAYGDEGLSKGYAPSLSATIDSLTALLSAFPKGWDAAAGSADIEFPRFGPVRNCGDPAAQIRIKGIRDKCRKRMGKVTALLSESSQQLFRDIAEVYPAVRGLFGLVLEFSEAYRKRKKDRGILDFSDLEHFAVNLLTGPDGAPTELAHQWAARYCEVMVDEYQDTNEVQNTIFTAISEGGRKLFQVGDVKQSIYRFRLADPTIFLKKYRSFKPFEEAAEGEPRRILLNRNFRSRPQVLEGANFLFRNIMSIPFGEMDYTEEESLHPGADFPGNPDGYAVELDALDLSSVGEKDDGEDKPARDLMEARFVARRIEELLNSGFPVSGGDGKQRPACPGDMVILLRSPGTVLHHYAQALGERNLPWEADGGGDFLDATEVSVALSFLRIVDNPRQDIPLISVLRSPLYGFSADRLAEIRAGAEGGDFYGALLGDDGPDAVSFLADLSVLRDQACDMSCRQLLWALYKRTNLIGIFGAMGDGESRRGNLLALVECAQQFEEAGYKGLFSFLSYLDRVRANGGRFSRSSPAGEGAGVRILSIHKSKGLEFPIVFLCGLARRFNREDMRRPMLFHPVLGVGPKGLDRERMVEYTTLARKAVSVKLEQEMMAEELRLLYVAVTRAREKLILVCALSGGGADLQRLAEDAECPVEPQALLNTQSTAQWVLLPALARPDGEALRRGADVCVEPTAGNCGPAWDIRWVDGSDLAVCQEELPGEGRSEQREEVPWEKDLLSRLTWRYPHGGDIEIPSKLTATQLKGRVLDEEAAEAAPKPSRALAFRQPRAVLEELGLTPAQKGTALHLVMQFINFGRTDSLMDVEEEIKGLVNRQMITHQQGEAASAEKILAFFASELGREVRAAPSLRREFKFSVLTPARDYYPEAGAGEKILLQGVIDCWFETESGLTLLDFKTDRVTEDTIFKRVEEYRPQLAAYSRALEEVTGKKVSRKILWFFQLDRGVTL